MATAQVSVMFSPSFLTLDFCKDFEHSDVHGVWAALRLKLHLKRGSSFRGPNLCEKVRHIVGFTSTRRTRRWCAKRL